MQIGIKAVDHIYLWNVKKNKQNKVFFRIKNQMYKVYRSELRRMFITKYGEYDGTDEIIMFIEEAIQPYHPKNMSYDQDDTMMDIDARKFTYGGILKGGFFAKLSNGLAGQMWPLIVVAVAGIAVLYGFLGAM